MTPTSYKMQEKPVEKSQEDTRSKCTQHIKLTNTFYKMD